ncbi:MAG: hypothetical protein SWC96_06705 [Thermodesulfobacteriota bacterium]|nr:hypothetical protein [Thermodesulfobacteriota bacterium]
MSNNEKPARASNIRIPVLAAVLLAALAAGIFFWHTTRSGTSSPPVSEETVSRTILPAEQAPEVLDYDDLDDNDTLAGEMNRRKEKYGLDGGVDLVAREDEAVKIGNQTVAMRTIAEDADIDRGKVVESDLAGAGRIDRDRVREYGIHVVRPGENLWNIHFRLLADYLEEKGITLDPLSDEAARDGTSSGVGKILKFSEATVTIYNLKDRRTSTDLHMIHPLEKIVVYRMDEVFALLDQIDYKSITKLEFDGDTLWLPAKD